MVKALFLDRDGVINVDYGYVYQQERFIFIDGIFDFCKAACDLGYLLIVITNQSGIARGYYSHDDFLNITSLKKLVDAPFMKVGHGCVIKALLQGDLEIVGGEVIDHAGLLA